ncbi:hypothetical protein [Rothia aerolata]|uniref:Uncharacterized protein n=1 Tax=Rothia aerolata TaxID=1812262 RepID=A0A917MT23_9MICC|nr:hypothetical protein [Rothia aerolata]GGH62609.1 hypothetical protein GCM10007359_13020 [Rothia aerolata]
MQSTGSQKSKSQTTTMAITGAALGGIILLALFIVAIISARSEESVLGWIVAGIILAWLGVAVYLASLVNRQAKSSQQRFEELARSRRAEEDSMLDDKLAHSFQIIQVQTKVIEEQRATPGDDAEGMIDRAIDTIKTTAANGMGMVKEAKN